MLRLISHLLFSAFFIGLADAFVAPLSLLKNSGRVVPPPGTTPPIIGNICDSLQLPRTTRPFYMVKFNGEKWVAESPKETAAAGYPVFNTLFRHGPLPFYTRVFQPDDYEQVKYYFIIAVYATARLEYGSNSLDCVCSSIYLLNNLAVHYDTF